MPAPAPNHRHWRVVIPLAALGAFVAAGLFGFTGLYVLELDSAPFRMVARVIPFPAASVDGSFISYAEWSDDTRAFIALAEAGKISIPGAVSRQDIGRNVLDRLVRNKVLASIAEEEGIRVTSEEIDAEYRFVVGDKPQEEVLLGMLEALHWTPGDLKEKVIAPYLIGRRLGERLGGTEAAEKRVEDELAKMKVKVFISL